MRRWHTLDKVLLGAFLFWSAAGLIFILGRITPAGVAYGPLPGWLKAFVGGCLRMGDPILILLAFANTHVHAARQWTPRVARRWGFSILACSLVIETVGTLTGFPFGTYHYTDRFGPMLGVVPLTIPLAWHVVITNALFVARALARHVSRLMEAGLTALICTAYDFILEPFATGAKQYWIWAGGTIPAQNYVAWFILSGALVWGVAPTGATRVSVDPRPAVLLGVTLLLFVAGTWV